MSRSSRLPLRRAAAMVPLLLAVASFATVACDRLPSAPPGGTASDCSDISWGSAPKSATRMVGTAIAHARAGSHRCFDRFVVHLDAGAAPGWMVQYRPVEAPGSGDLVVLRGSASLEVVVQAPGHDRDLVPSYDPPKPTEAVDVTGFPTLRQVAFAGSFEGTTTFGLGVRSRLPFRVFAVEDPAGPRLVVDVAHRWA